jgi:membrane-associated protein
MLLGGITDSIDPQQLLETFGVLGLFAIIFAESGLLIGFFLPGDSLLFTAGLFASQGKFGLNLPVVLVGVFFAAVIGDQVGYLFGKKVGPSIFRRADSRLFKQEYVVKADAFFEKHGPKTIVLARFVPVVRTFVPVLAGVGKMHYRTFVTYNVLGGFLWAVGITGLGAILGNQIGAENIDKYLLPLVAVIILLSITPAVVEVVRHRRATNRVSEAEAQAMATHLHDELEH